MDEEDRYTRITLRIPKELHTSLSEAAEKTSKSLNAEIIGRLSDSFSFKHEADESAAERVEAIGRRVERSAKEAHLAVLIMGLQSQLRDCEHRRTRQLEIVKAISDAVMKAEEDDPVKCRALESELSAEGKWLSEINMEYARLVAELSNLQQTWSELVGVGAH
ncbi:hypothetical protein HNP33_002042 [Comamonas odontotermitis]|uniref:Arc-like DNA binding domain-containing protein n=1 Tax=Comamonas odontotermitis TaxID=379895 RepID=A0ABR6RG19_9BURK|nr:Arc family DNA-binding protein [Comamonas odontotermitis]MBB6577974.1 hypothetical protein [Comamonas odontotermitis]